MRVAVECSIVSKASDASAMPDKCSPMPHALRTQQSPEDAAAEEALAVRRYVRALAQAESVRDELP